MKDTKITFRVDDKHRKEMVAAAKKAGKRLSSWLRIVTREEISRTRRERWEA